MIDLVQQLEIIAEQATCEMQELLMWACLVILALGCVAWFAYAMMKQMKRLRDCGPMGAILISAFVVILVLYGGSKPDVKWDIGIENNGTSWIVETNATTKIVSTNGVHFAWKKTNAEMPDSVSLDFMRRTKDATAEDWTILGTEKVGTLKKDFTFDNSTEYEYYVCHYWVPPTPVHTNGVWLGQVLERAKGTKDNSKIVVIHGVLMKDGVQIAPMEVK